jgi:predicted outer membrane repeat protein
MKSIIFCLGFVFSFSALLAQTRYYVHQSATGANSGQSWQDAFSDLQLALETAQAGDDIWVAKGTYFPTPTTDRNISFEPASGVKLYGGFTGAETDLNQRNWEVNETILSGDIGVLGDSMDNSLTVVYLFEPDSNTVMNGFRIRHGHANDINSSVPLSRFRSGGGLYLMGQSSDAYPEIRNCVFEYNSSVSFGAAVMINGTNNGSVSPWFVQCRFEKNRTLGSGGAIAQFGGSLVERGIEFQACTFLQNTANSHGGGIYYADGRGLADLEIGACVFEQNMGARGGGGLYLILGRDGGASCKVRGSTFYQNVSVTGAAIQTFPQGIAETKSFVVDSCMFNDNVFAFNPNSTYPSSVLLFDNINNSNSKIVFSNCKIINNKNWETILIMSTGGFAPLVLERFQFIDNKSSAILDATTTNQISISEAKFLGNISQGDYTVPLSLRSTKTSIENFLSAKNTTLEDYFSITFPSPLRIENAVFADYNISLPGGGGLLKPDSLIIRNSTFSNFIRPVNFFRSSKRTGIAYCHIDSITCNLPPFANVTCGPGNLFNLDPLFRDTANNDYSLLPCSPLINAGSNLAAAGILTDIAGNPRILEGTVDIGAYEAPAFALAASPAVSPACVGTEGGSISIQPVNGCEPYTYNWMPNAGTGPELNELPPGAYQLTLTDASGREITETVLVPEAPQPALSLATTHVQCGNPAGGSLAAQVSSGTGPFNYTWLPLAEDTSMLNNLAAGDYALTIVDANGCQDSATAAIALMGQITLTIGGQIIPCHGETGWLSATPSTGAAPFTWHWDGWPGTDPVAEPLGPGQYSVTVTDAYGCTAANTYPPMTEPGPLSVGTGSSDQTQSNPPNGAAVVTTISGGTGPFGYLWEPGGGTTQSIAGLVAGTYTVTVTDKNGCSVSTEVVVELMVSSTAATLEAGVIIYPNPAVDWLRVLLPATQSSSSWHLELSDASGRVLRSQGCASGDCVLDLSGLASGAYVLTAWNGERVFVGKVVRR